MTTDAASVPDWTIGDRLAKALRARGIGVQQMADDLGVSRNTVTNYIHDKSRVPRPTLILWAMRTQVPLSWLETGEMPGPDDSPDGTLLPWFDSNEQPSGYLYPLVTGPQISELLDAA